MSAEPLRCHEVARTDGHWFESLRRLYGETRAADDQVLWRWVEGAVGRAGEPGKPRPRVLVAGLGEAAAGFIYGQFLPGYGGYVCYLGVAPQARRRGVGVFLFESLFDFLAADARAAGESLPFVLWETRPPASDAERPNWAGRVRLFRRLGSRWIDGVTFHAPDYVHPEPDEPVRLRLLLKPFDRPSGSFTPADLIAAVRGLQTRVYRLDESDPLVGLTLPAGCSPHLREVGDAD